MNNNSSGLPVAKLRRLAKHKPSAVRRSHGPAASATVRWQRKHPKASDADILARQAFDLRLAALEAAAKSTGLPDPTSLDYDYTRWGRIWHRRFLAKTFDRCGITPETFDRITLIDRDVRFDQYTSVVTCATNLAQAASDTLDAGARGDDVKAFATLVADQLAVTPPKRRNHYAWLRRLAVVDQAASGLLAPVADVPGFAHLSLADRTRLALSGLMSSLDAPLLPAAAVALSRPTAQTRPLRAKLDDEQVQMASTVAKALDGDVVRARLMAHQRHPTFAELEPLGSRDAVEKWGSVSDAAYAHLAATPLARYADDVAAAFTAAGLSDTNAKAAVRRLSPPALESLLAHTPAPSREDVVAAVKVASAFRRRTGDFLRGVNAAARRHHRSVPKLSKLGSWLPSGGDLSSFVSWLLAAQRTQAVLTAQGRAELASIVVNFDQLADSEQALSVSETATKLRLRGYGPVGETAFGMVCADAGISAQLANANVERWTKSLSTPQLFPTGVRFTDRKTPYTARFLPRDDPRGLWLGQLTDCCQYPSSVGETCAWAGCELALHGFFVVEDAKREVIAQSWVWSDGKGGVCFDSVERRNRRVSLNSNATKSAQRRARAVRRLYRKAAEHLLGWFDVVNIGPAWGLGELTRQVADEALVPDSYHGYRDSNTQHSLAERDSATDAVKVRKAPRNSFKVYQGRKLVATVTADGIKAGSKVASAEVFEVFSSFGHDTNRLGLEDPSAPPAASGLDTPSGATGSSSP
jgi:hypothetical protein